MIRNIDSNSTELHPLLEDETIDIEREDMVNLFQRPLRKKRHCNYGATQIPEEFNTDTFFHHLYDSRGVDDIDLYGVLTCLEAGDLLSGDRQCLVYHCLKTKAFPHVIIKVVESFLEQFREIEWCHKRVKDCVQNQIRDAKKYNNIANPIQFACHCSVLLYWFLVSQRWMLVSIAPVFLFVFVIGCFLYVMRIFGCIYIWRHQSELFNRVVNVFPKEHGPSRSAFTPIAKQLSLTLEEFSPSGLMEGMTTGMWVNFANRTFFSNIFYHRHSFIWYLFCIGWFLCNIINVLSITTPKPYSTLTYFLPFLPLSLVATYFHVAFIQKQYYCYPNDLLVDFGWFQWFCYVDDLLSIFLFVAWILWSFSVIRNNDMTKRHFLYAICICFLCLNIAKRVITHWIVRPTIHLSTHIWNLLFYVNVTIFMLWFDLPESMRAFSNNESFSAWFLLPMAVSLWSFAAETNHWPASHPHSIFFLSLMPMMMNARNLLDV